MTGVESLTLLGVAAAWLGACAPNASTAPTPPCEQLRRVERSDEINVVLIVNDAMRRDRVGLYGGTANTPVFDAFARENVYFDHAYAQAPWTKPSIATLFTSLYPSQHSLASHPKLRQRADRGSDQDLGEADVLNDGLTTLAEVLRDAGYRTAAFVSNPWMDAAFGFAQGFETYDDSFSDWDASGDVISRAALLWLEQLEPSEKSFLYLHYIDSHAPYGRLTDSDIAENLHRLQDRRPMSRESVKLYRWLIDHPHQQLSVETVERLNAMRPSLGLIDLAYDLGVEQFDHALGAFLAQLSEHSGFDRTAILITSDHGEALYDRGYGNHGKGLFDDEAAVPLAARLPGVSVGQARVECSVGLIDIMPTLCSYLDLECPEKLFGSSFIAGTHEAAPRQARYIVTEGVMFEPRNRSLRNRIFKLIWEPGGTRAHTPGEYSLFNTREDPYEKRNLLTSRHRSAEYERVSKALELALTDSVPDFDRPAATFAPMPRELEQRLRALGYLE